jgi:hypothetical protein
MIFTVSSQSAHALGQRRNVSLDTRKNVSVANEGTICTPAAIGARSPFDLEFGGKYIRLSKPIQQHRHDSVSDTFPCGRRQAGQGLGRVKKMTNLAYS